MANQTGTPTGEVFTTSGDPIVDGVLQGGEWVTPIPTTQADPLELIYDIYSSTDTSLQWSAAQSAALAQIFQAWSNVTNVTFTPSILFGLDTAPSDDFKTAYVDTGVDMALVFIGTPVPDDGTLAFAGFPDPARSDDVLGILGEDRTSYPNPEGDIFIYNEEPEFDDANMNAGGYGFDAILHEIGHVLGLKHPFDDGGTSGIFPILPSAYDNQYVTVMGYNTPQDVDQGFVSDESVGFVSTPMPLDILAIQFIYGVNTTFHAAGDNYDLSLAQFQNQVQTIWDAGGVDTLDASGVGNAVSLTLVQGGVSYIGTYSAVALAYTPLDASADPTIENAIGSDYNDDITGNDVVNTIDGGLGNDTLDGGAGDDTLIGGLGNDTYVVDSALDVVTENPGEGTDTISSSTISLDLASYPNFENILLTGSAAIDGTGDANVNVITGNSGVNSLDGGDGNDTLDGGGGDDSVTGNLGDDSIIGGAGNDTLFGDVGNDSISGGTGNDTLLGDVGNDTLSGGSGNDTLDGSVGTDTMDGGTGDDTLDGGAGDDTMQGGFGNDTFIIDSLLDVINDTDGNDTIFTPFDYTANSIIENIVLTGAATTATGNALNNALTGNTLDNTLIGLAGNDTLDGGVGNDTMDGGVGNDTFFVDSAGDVLIDAGGVDTVESAITYTLGAAYENLTLTGSANIDGTGNALVNIIIGNSGDNTLNGGAGSDTMSGGDGNDTYLIDRPSEILTENAGAIAGTADTVIVSFNWTLGDNFENLTLTGSNFAGTGNALDNIITGNVAGNALNGMAGADTLIGGLGSDTYFVDDALDVVIELPGQGLDTIKSYVDYTLAANVETLQLLAPGHTATGNALDPTHMFTLMGTGGNDTLDDGGGLANMIAGGGNDTFVVSNAADKLSDGGGVDLVMSSVNWTLVVGFENLTLTGGAISGTGNAGNNIITGNANANFLDSGLGFDTLIGGDGNDTYIVRTAADVITETGVADTDTIVSFVGFDMTNVNNVENLVLSGSAAGFGTGNTLDNTITGTSGFNILDGGTAGADSLLGGLGNDIYIVDHLGVSVIENAASGNDTVKTSLDNYFLDANVENLALLGSSGLTATGNGLLNSITGTTGDDVLDGAGGADKMAGGFGSDTYFVDVATDVITESGVAGSGNDSVISSAVSYTLGLNVENLTLTGAAVRGTGNASANVMTGDDLANTLNGGSGNDTLEGGLLADTLIGGLGADTFVFKAASMDGTLDAITDFNKAIVGEKIDISDLLSGSGYIPGLSTVTDYVQILTVSTHSELYVDTTGTATFGLAEKIATINGVGLTDEVALVNTGHLFLG
jgi:Ca2+-binding RTX toxin-like protein